MSMSLLTSEIKNGHPAIVEISFIVSGTAHRMGQLGPDFRILETPFTHAPRKAENLIDLDVTQDRWTVFLPHGVSQTKRRIPTAAI